MEYPLDPEAELVVWGPAPVKVFYAYWIQSNFYDFPRAYGGLCWPTAIELIVADRFAVILDEKQLNATGAAMLRDVMLDRQVREPMWRAYRRALSALEDEEQKVDATQMPVLSDERLIAIWGSFLDVLDAFWIHTIAPEIANYGSVEVLRAAIAPYVSQEQQHDVLEALTAPETLSFYQLEEIELAETDNIAAHARKYFWLKNGYDHVQTLPETYFADRKRQLNAGLRKTNERRLEETRNRKRAMRERCKLPPEVVAIADAIVNGIEWQDDRKRHVLVTLHYLDTFLNEIVRRYGYEKDDLLNCQPQEINELLASKELPVGLSARKDAFGFLLQKEDVRLLGPEQARAYWDAYLNKRTAASTNELVGAVACKGNGVVRGRVRIVLNPRISSDFNDHEILVTTMTTPEYIFIMKKAAAIITDNGGLTSHAAIVSRELNVPCIVGTKHATQLLKDGDMVEVDAERGIVRKL
jgi:phosphohistidine swiveling domain-containing protein